MTSGLPRVVPWADWDEWLHVRNQLFSSESVQKLAGLEIVALWRLRGKLPHAIDSTAQFVNVRINSRI